MKKCAVLFVSLWVFCFMVVVAEAQTKASMVTLEVTLPNGETRQVIAPAGEQVTIKAADDTEFGFRATVRESDDSQVEVTIIKIGSPDEPLGTVEVKIAEPAVDSKTAPAFKIAVLKVAAPDEG